MNDRSLFRPPGWRVSVYLDCFQSLSPLASPRDIHHPGRGVHQAARGRGAGCPSRRGGSRRGPGRAGRGLPRLGSLPLGSAKGGLSPAPVRASRRGRRCESEGRQCEGAGPGQGRAAASRPSPPLAATLSLSPSGWGRRGRGSLGSHSSSLGAWLRRERRRTSPAGCGPGAVTQGETWRCGAALPGGGEAAAAPLKLRGGGREDRNRWARFHSLPVRRPGCSSPRAGAAGAGQAGKAPRGTGHGAEVTAGTGLWWRGRGCGAGESRPASAGEAAGREGTRSHLPLGAGEPGSDPAG